MKKKYLAVFSIALIAVIIDQIVKFLIRINFELNQTIPILKNIFHLTYINNYGAGFGILQQQKWILIFISLIVIGFILYYLDRIKEKEAFLQVLVGLVLGGTIGNLIDRISFGYVVDFLDFRIWPIFNFADSFVTIGIIGLIVYFWKE
ncbi:MAG: signal peptidase II [Candidatus Woesearchaeota archaeon]|jgi:signal peptidase II|nr:signal peptidase II [Candidatus Woesearchaeota archaeon]MDP7623261.1 signal peptidase II [Candidatus Woesearchaeota archaeon]HJN56650.1 signal peptidase II [Candidatus Woesearchaeota archaeon]|tara:strand:- start:58 stop:501 length:444 start_codon:yes stop_codon:yes gene_type:complete